MAIYEYKKYKISLKSDTKKTQGLRTGDIVRRQYFDGTNTVYSLMCVLSYGTEDGKPFFVGALLEGDIPKTGEILDFVRVTSITDTSRSGALYLTASDEDSPYMDVIDGIGKNCSLSWPTGIAGTTNIDSSSQYVISTNCAGEYIESENDSTRICHLTVSSSVVAGDFVGIKQDFYQYVKNPNRVIISYRVKAKSNMTGNIKIGYTDATKTDGSVDVDITTDWTYHIHAITIENSGRYLRTLQFNILNAAAADEVYISDLNVILLSSLSNFGGASKVRIGKIDGIVDPVFGKLDGYGGYLQKLFASNSVHISGTLTAGDSNGFGATFYAGKIYKNEFINSLEPKFTSGGTVDATITSPTGIGNVIGLASTSAMHVQTNAWVTSHVKSKYVLSFWYYAYSACQVIISQNGSSLGVIKITESEALKWIRHKMTFEVQTVDVAGADMSISIQCTASTTNKFSSPQLESGINVTQYQPTDDVLNDTDEYGAWFSRGGIGGTIQNPLLKLNYDGNGGIATRNNSLELKQDGSGQLANNNIKWNASGNVTFGDKVVLGWSNLDSAVKNEVTGKLIKIIGSDSFSYMGDATGSSPVYVPSSIDLTINPINFALDQNCIIKWYYLDKTGTYILIDGGTSSVYNVDPNSTMWSSSTLTLKATVSTSDGKSYEETFTVKKTFIVGFTVSVESSQSVTFKNGSCQTTLTANVYYQGKLVSEDYVAANFNYTWKKYHLPDKTNEVADWWKSYTDSNGVAHSEVVRTNKTLPLDYLLKGSDYFDCELSTKVEDGFPYALPIIFA